MTAAEAGPEFQTCPNFKGIENATIAAARAAMAEFTRQAISYNKATTGTATSRTHAKGDQPRSTRQPPGETGPSPNSAPTTTDPKPPAKAARTTGALCSDHVRQSLRHSLESSRPTKVQRGTEPLANAGLIRLADPRFAPPPVLDPFEIPFPTELATEAPGLYDVLTQCGAQLMECGMTTAGASPAEEWHQNQCLYLSLAAATSTNPATIHAMAGAMRAGIEDAVRADRPDWAEADFLGQEGGAFADFLIWGEPAVGATRGRAIAVYDQRTGTCEIFRLPSRAAANRAVIGLWFSGAHYRWVRWRDPGPTLSELLTLHSGNRQGTPQVPTLVTATRE